MSPTRPWLAAVSSTSPRTGTLIYRRASRGASGMTTVQWVDAAGKKEPLRAKPGAYQDLRLSPDGKRIALVVIERGESGHLGLRLRSGTP